MQTSAVLSTTIRPDRVLTKAQTGYFCNMSENDRLLQLLREDEHQFMKALFQTYFALVCKSIYRLVPDMATAEDLAQEVFIKVWNRRDQLGEVYFKAYLHRAGVNMALDHIDKNKRRGGRHKRLARRRRNSKPPHRWSTSPIRRPASARR